MCLCTMYICKILCKPYISNIIFTLQYFLIESQSGFGDNSERLIYKKKCQSASISYYTKMTEVSGMLIDCSQSTILMNENAQKYKKMYKISPLNYYSITMDLICPFSHLSIDFPNLVYFTDF